MDGDVLVIVGKSGTGKSRLAQTLKRKMGYPTIISCTTRSPRPRERDGRDYHFISKEEAARTDFLEQTVFSGNVYGTRRADVEGLMSTHPVSVLVADAVGAQAMRKKYGKRAVLMLLALPEGFREKILTQRDGEEKAKARLDSEPDVSRDSADFDFVVYNDGNHWDNYLDAVKSYFFAKRLTDAFEPVVVA